MTTRSAVSKYTAVLLGGAALATVAAVSAFSADDAASQGPATLRLTTAQYRQIIGDVFGPTVNAGGRFDPDIRYNGLVQLGAGRVSITASGLEGYDATARKIAEQVVSKDHRATLIPCTPKAADAADDACARQFLGDVGRLLYRRPLTDGELTPASPRRRSRRRPPRISIAVSRRPFRPCWSRRSSCSARTSSSPTPRTPARSA